MESPRTLQEAILHFADFENCKAFMMELRWPDGVVKCPHCGSTRVIFLAKARVWKCCEKHQLSRFSLKIGTIFEDSPLGLDKWLTAVWLIVNCKERHQQLRTAPRSRNYSEECIWFMNHRIRFALHQPERDG